MELKLNINKKGIVLALHHRPDADCFFSAAFLHLIGGIKITGYWFITTGDEPMPPQIVGKNIVFVDRGRRDFDHHSYNESKTTSTQKVTQWLGIEKEKWVQPILKYVHRCDLRGQSQPFDINDFGKALARNEKLSDEERIILGMKMAEAIIIFHKEGLERDNEFARKILLEFLKTKRKIPPRWQRYLQQLKNSRFERVCDFVEIVCGQRKLTNERETMIFALNILTHLYLDFERYQKAKVQFLSAKKIQIKTKTFGETFIVAEYSENPKFAVVAREAGALVVIQKQKTEHTQIFFDFRRIRRSEITDNIVAALRLSEMIKRNIPFAGERNKKYLTQLGVIPEVPQWYYFAGETGNTIILNGSLTAPERPPTKLSLEEIVAIVKLALKDH